MTINISNNRCVQNSNKTYIIIVCWLMGDIEDEQ